jgi:hypothetical protein
LLYPNQISYYLFRDSQLNQDSWCKPHGIREKDIRKGKLVWDLFLEEEAQSRQKAIVSHSTQAAHPVLHAEMNVSIIMTGYIFNFKWYTLPQRSSVHKTIVIAPVELIFAQTRYISLQSLCQC